MLVLKKLLRFWFEIIELKKYFLFIIIIIISVLYLEFNIVLCELYIYSSLITVNLLHNVDLTAWSVLL